MNNVYSGGSTRLLIDSAFVSCEVSSSQSEAPLPLEFEKPRCPETPGTLVASL